MDDKTKLLHGVPGMDPHTRAASIPIYQVSTYAQENPPHTGPYEYGRGQNPTRDALEEGIAAMEEGERGFAFASGVAAMGSALLLFKPGDHLVVAEDIYGGTYRLLTTLFAQWGLRHTFVDASDPQRIEDAVEGATRALLVETPSNPTLKITDLAAVAQIAQRRGLLSIIDNTFMTPYLQKPIPLGFDLVLHSATKFLGGHSDLIAGLAVTRDQELGKRLKSVQNGFGAILGPMDSWLVLRGMRTLAARMEAQQAGAERIARWLAARPEVKTVHYPALEGHPGRATHFAQSRGAGAVVSFDLGDEAAAHRLMRRVKLPLVAVSLGGVESILSYPATMSHAAMPAAERRARGIGDGLLRLSVGLEAPEDLIADLDAALSGEDPRPA